MLNFKYRHFQKLIILQSVRWYLSYSLSYRDVEELMKERGCSVDHSTVQRWVVKYSPELEAKFHKHKKRVGDRWRLDETYIKVKCKWKYLYRAVDKEGSTVDFLLTAKCDKKAAKRFLAKAIGRNGKPTLINIDKSGSNKAAIVDSNKDDDTPTEVRQCKYLNNIVEQDHRGIKRVTRSMLGFKEFHAAQKTITGIELIRMLKKGQMIGSSKNTTTPSYIEQFYALAA